MHSANTEHQQFTLGPLLDLIHLSSSLALIGTCNSTFSASAGVVGASSSFLPTPHTKLTARLDDNGMLKGDEDT